MQICLTPINRDTICGAANSNDAKSCATCGYPLEKVLKLRDKGDLVGGYTIQSSIGHGSFGAVYAVVHHQQPDRLFALKETRDPLSTEGLAREFHMLQHLEHPNMPRYYAWFTYESYGYLVMEFIPGQNLEEALSQQNGPIPQAQVLDYAAQLCEVLHYLHTRPTPILHRDIKPANIRLTKEGLVKLVDFGLLKHAGKDTWDPLKGMGTPAYTPLEQYAGSTQHTDARSDIYSLAATLYHLLSGTPPLPAGARVAPKADPLPPLDRVNPALSPHVTTAVMQALRLQMEDRQPDMASFKAALLVPAWVPALIPIPAGPFVLGSSANDPAARANELPQQTLTLPDYWIGKTPVTNAQFRPFVAGDGYTNQAYWTPNGWVWRQAAKRQQPYFWNAAKWNGDTYPVVGVTWYEAVAYCAWLSAQTGQDFRLPTEAEWEKAARGPDGRIYPWGDTWEEGRCNSEAAGLKRTSPVSQYPTGASPYGVLDMAGNVWEWCSSSYKQYPAGCAVGQKDFTVDVWDAPLRGGSWFSERIYVRCAARDGGPPNIYGYVNDGGFRVVLSPRSH